MELKELIKKIRLEKRYSLEILGSKLGFSKDYLHKVETGLRPASDKLFKSLIVTFPMYKEKMIELYGKDKLSEDILSDIFSHDRTITKIKEYKLKVYDFVSECDGRIEFDKYEKINFLFNEEDKKNIVDNSFAFKILSDNMRPYFQEGDIIYFSKKVFKNLEELDKRLILFYVNDKYYIRKVQFIKRKVYLTSFNEVVYPEIEVSEKIQFVGILSGQLKRHINKIKF